MRLKRALKNETRMRLLYIIRASNSETEFRNSVMGDFNIFQKYTFSKLIPFQNSIAKRLKFGFEMKKNGIMTFHKFMLFMNFVKIWQFLLLLAQILNSVINSLTGNKFRF